jgi:Multicopper oxidase
MIIHGPKNAAYDIDVGPVFLSDWYHREYFKIVEDVVGPVAADFSDVGKIVPFSDNNLINGKMNFNCSTVAASDTASCVSDAGLSKFKFTTGKTHR